MPQHNMHTMAASNGNSNRIELIDNIGGVNHPVSTKSPNNPRALFGLGISLELQKRKNEAAAVKNQFKQQWKWADTELSIEEL